MGVPDVRLAKIDLHQGDARLDQATAEQEALAHQGPAVAVAESGLLAIEFERGAAGGRGEDVRRPSSDAIERPRGGLMIEIAALGIDRVEQGEPIIKPFEADLLRQGQIRRSEARLRHIADEVPGVVLGTEEAGVLAGEGGPLEGQVRRQDDRLRQALRRRLRRGEQGPQVRAVLPRGGNSRAGGNFRHAAEETVDGQFMHGAGRPHRANEREPVQAASQFGQVLTEADAGQGGRDRAERAADLPGGVGLGIERLQLARPAGAERQDHAPDRFRRPARHGPPAQQVGQAQAEPGNRPGAEDRAAGVPGS